ncbi:MAG: GNAT family N-acetyltransferase [Clostridiales bacterium]|nr:GNAT family N-acetyltransferase [Clostridiales bacterium]
MMKILLRKMTPCEFENFCACSAKAYAADLQNDEGISEQEALAQALQELKSELPQGADTPGHCLMMVVNRQSGDVVGFLWYLYEFTEGVKQVFLSDILIYETERRKGFATAALAEMERLAGRDGCKESIVYVWKHNPQGIRLYTKAGYRPLRELDGGIYLKKVLY